MILLVGLLLATAGTLVSILAAYLLILALASLFARPQERVPGLPANRLLVLVPAHNEELLIARCVSSLRSQDYPTDLLDVVVIADNCTDATAARARAAGAAVLVRTDPANQGKGQALRWAIDRLLDGTAFDAVVVVDADSVVKPGFLRVLESELRAGHDVVQADYSLRPEGGQTRSELAAAGFLLFHRVRFGGRRRLGLAANLVGNGMLFSREVLLRHPWSAFSGVEDLEYSIDLRLDGIKTRFAPSARIEGPAAASRGGALRQRLRWEGGRFHVMRTRLPVLARAILSRPAFSLLDAAIDLATPPIALLVMITGAGLIASLAATSVGLAPAWAALPWAIALASIGAFVSIGLVSARAPWRTWRAMGLAPAFLAWKLAAYVRLSRGFDPRRWDRTDRSGESARAAVRPYVAGVPVDPVDMEGALDRICAAVGGPALLQVSTVNLDFLVRARTDPAVRAILRRCDLNLADGAPVVWLGRLLGVRLSVRVAGADLVPLLAGRLAATGGRLFLLGGEDGAAEKAALKLRESNPALVIAGTYEPRRCALEEMPIDDIVQRIAESRADVLLVAFGHPKQEKFIDMCRDRLPVSVAIGVGCVFDLLSGRSRRAPAWIQAVGLEWAFRMVQEPRRLVRRYVIDAAWLIPIAALVLRQRLAGAPTVAET